MTSIVIAMITVLVISFAIIALVLIGLQGRGSKVVPKLAGHANVAAQHLNGDAAPPKRLVRLIESRIAR